MAEAWRKARDRDVWHQVVSTATLHSGVHTPGGSTLQLWLGERQEIGTFGIRLSVRQRSTLEFTHQVAALCGCGLEEGKR